MVISKLTIKGFRNLVDCELNTCSKNIILTGKNGQGKTNLLEAVYTLCYGSSFRTKNLKDAINFDKDFFNLKCEFFDELSCPRTIEILFNSERKIIKVDNQEIRDRKELIYCIPCIVFSHDDMEIVRGEPELRRRFFDQTMTLQNSMFFDDLRAYKAVLRQRNAAIKDKRFNIMDILDERLVQTGIPIIEERKKMCASFNEIFPKIYNKVSGFDDNIYMRYRPSWAELDSKEKILENLASQRETDFKMGTTTTGPHRDRFSIVNKNGLFINSASTGQIRLATLALKSTQGEFYRQKTGLAPVYLIDDVLLELDAAKRDLYLSCFGEYKQAFFTFLPDEHYFKNEQNDSIYYDVEEGIFNERV